MISDTYDLKVFFDMVYHYAFNLPEEEDEFFPEYIYFERFMETSFSSLVFGNLNFFSSAYYDFLHFNKWDLFEGTLLLYDSAGANMHAPFNTIVDLDDQLEEEDYEFLWDEVFEYNYSPYMFLEIDDLDDLIFNDVPFFFIRYYADSPRAVFPEKKRG